MKALMMSELRQRIRGRKWWVLLVLWFLILLGLVSLVRGAAEPITEFPSADPSIGPVMFGALVLFVLGLMSLMIPALTSTSINGERDKGTLAVLQSTLLRPLEIAFAKFSAAMLIALAFLAATLPLALWSATEGGIELGRAVVVYILLVLVAALLILIGLASSAVVPRPSISAVTAYGLVFLLTLGSPILFGLSLASAPVVGFEREVGWRWLLLAPNPFVVVADAAPRSGDEFAMDPLQGIRDAVRNARQPPRVENVFGDLTRSEPQEPPALWPTGMMIDVLLAALAVYLAVVRLRIPAGRLGIGERVA